MTDEVHPLVTLLVARAKSHPEEFRGGRPNALNLANRWWFAVDTIRRDGTAEDKALLASTIGRVLMDEAHEWALDELMNGEQRRAGKADIRRVLRVHPAALEGSQSDAADSVGGPQSAKPV